MEQKLAYNLYHRKGDFLTLLNLNDLHYDKSNNISDMNGKTIGRILNSNPPYLIIYPLEKGDSKSKEKASSKLVKLANDFEIS